MRVQVMKEKIAINVCRKFMLGRSILVQVIRNQLYMYLFGYMPLLHTGTIRYIYKSTTLNCTSCMLLPTLDQTIVRALVVIQNNTQV